MLAVPIVELQRYVRHRPVTYTRFPLTEYVLDAGAIPIADAALIAFGADRALEAALHGGEDYELLFVTDPGVVDVDYFEGRFGLDLTRVGHVLEGQGVWIDSGVGTPQPLERSGFDHFDSTDR